MNKITEYFGTMVFNDNVRKEMLPPEAYKSLQETIENGTSLDISLELLWAVPFLLENGAACPFQ